MDICKSECKIRTVTRRYHQINEFTPRVNWSGREADHSPPSTANVKNAWNYTSTPLIRLHGVMLS